MELMEMQTNELKKAAEFGTPLYVFYEEELQETTRRFQNTLGKVAGLCYAMKANPFLVKVMEPIVDRIEVCSMGEFAICEEQGVAPEKILVSGVLKKAEKLNAVLDKYGNSCMYTAESLQQFELLKNWSAEHRQEISVFPRLTSGNQFGMDQKTIEELIENRQNYPFLKIRGIHYFSGTQKRSVGKIQKELEKLDVFLTELKQKYDFEPEELEYGPGMPVPYFDPSKAIGDDGLLELVQTLEQMNFSGRVTLEMGRAFAADCGYYLTKIMDVKSSDDRNYCITDGGIHQLNYDGQIRGMYEPPMEVLAEERQGEQKNWTICGSLCTVNDIMVQKLPLTDPKPGDVLVFKKTGAYSCMEGMLLFLSHSLPKIMLYNNTDGFRQVRKAYKTYKWNMEEK
jgi:diaminopimelate decarboxylase